MENNIINPHNELASPVKRNLPRDVFLHLFAMVTLYWSAISFITLCWQYINHFFPDVLLDGYSSPRSSITFALASLIIVFPLFLITSWILNNIYTKEAQVRESKIRKWLIYLTLFVTALVIIGDLIFVINTFLGGEITMRFVLKALSVLAVAAVIFGYYLDDVRRAIPPKSAKYFAILSGIIVAILFVGAFFIIGSPMNARLQQFDQQRVSDLQNIQWQVVNYWQRKATLPNTLADLNDPIAGFIVPVDPETKKPYEYSVMEVDDPRIGVPSVPSTQFALCATFNLSSDSRNTKTMPVPAIYPNDLSQNWNHPAGHFCFDRTIDQQLYPPLDKGK